MKPMYIKKKLITLLACSFAAVFCMNYHTGPAASSQFKTGAPFDAGDCSTCHGGGVFTPTTTIQLMNGATAVTTYTPGASYTVKITITGGTNFGFQIVCVNGSNIDYNGWGTLPPNTHNIFGNSRHYIEHTAILTSGVINIPWTAPTSGQVKFYACGNVVNADNTSNNDNPAAATLFVTPTTCTPPSISTAIVDAHCNGDSSGSVSLTVTGTGPFTYSWTGPGAFSAATQNISGVPAGSYSVLVTGAGSCTNTAVASVSQPTTVVTAHGSSNAPFCPGDTLFMVGTGTGTGTLSYSWAGPGGYSSFSQNPVIPNATPAVNGLYTITVTDANGCSAHYGNSVVIYPGPTVSLGPDAAICSGNPVTLDAGNPGCTYVWSTGATTQTITDTSTGTFYVTATNSTGCKSSDTIVVTNSTIMAPGITLTVTSDTVCAGAPTTFTAVYTGGGTAPVFQWRKNGVQQASTVSTYTTTTLNNGDYVTCKIFSNSPCAFPTTAFSDTIRMVVNPTYYPAVIITHVPDTACAGNPITFTANPINGGTVPFYEWFKNDTMVTTGSTYTYSPTVADTITCLMVSSLTCHSPDSVSSVSNFVINPSIVPIVTISKTPASDSIAYVNQIYTFNTTLTYGGVSPHFQWYINRVAVAGATNSTFAPHILTNDTVVCKVTSSAICAVPNIVTSNPIIIYASFLGIDDLYANHNTVSIFPNPSDGNFTLSGLVNTQSNDELLIEVRDLKGTIVYRKNASVKNGQLNESCSLGNQLAEGLYLLRVHSDTEDKFAKIVIRK